MRNLRKENIALTVFQRFRLSSRVRLFTGAGRTGGDYSARGWRMSSTRKASRFTCERNGNASGRERNTPGWVPFTGQSLFRPRIQVGLRLVKKRQTHLFTPSSHLFTPFTRVFGASCHLFGAFTRFSGPFTREEVAARTSFGASCHFRGASTHLFGESTRLAGAYAPEEVATRGKKPRERGKKVRLAHFAPGKGHLEPRAAHSKLAA